MRTSASQFQLLVEFMERCGDISKPSGGMQGRLTNIQRWEELTSLLNGDATGDTKSLDKWRKVCYTTFIVNTKKLKYLLFNTHVLLFYFMFLFYTLIGGDIKVWSDLKNNTKKKAARIHRAVSGTGGGPPLNSNLTDLELRILSITGTTFATGIVEIAEVGLTHETVSAPSPTASPSVVEEQPYYTLEQWSQPSTSSQPPCFPSLPVIDSESVMVRSERLRENSATILETSNIPLASVRTVSVSTPPPSDPTQQAALNPPQQAPLNPPPTGSSQPPSQSNSIQRLPPIPMPLPLTPRRRRRRHHLLRDTGSPTRRGTRMRTQSELAREAFVQSDCEWRAFQRDTERERIRLRERDQEQQQRWLELFGQFIALGSRLADIIEKK